MKLSNLIGRLRPARRRRPVHPDFAAGWSTRDWADLPTHHPRRDEDALH